MFNYGPVSSTNHLLNAKEKNQPKYSSKENTFFQLAKRVFFHFASFWPLLFSNLIIFSFLIHHRSLRFFLVEGRGEGDLSFSFYLVNVFFSFLGPLKKLQVFNKFTICKVWLYFQYKWCFTWNCMMSSCFAIASHLDIFFWSVLFWVKGDYERSLGGKTWVVFLLLGSFFFLKNLLIEDLAEGQVFF